MADYFFALDAADFGGRWRPALADAWRLRRFDVVRPLCSAHVPAASAFARRFRTGPSESMLERLAANALPFDRAVWRTLVAEVLLFSAVEVPEFQVNAETLTCLLAPRRYCEATPDRPQFLPIEQVLAGSRDLTFGAAVYRPEHAGYNSADDVQRLASYLRGIRPETWTLEGLSGLRDVPPEDRGEELESAREWFPALAEFYARTAARSGAIVYERIF